MIVSKYCEKLRLTFFACVHKEDGVIETEWSAPVKNLQMLSIHKSLSKQSLLSKSAITERIVNAGAYNVFPILN